MVCYRNFLNSSSALFGPLVSVLIIVFFTLSGSSLKVFREEADPGEGEESPWLLQGEKRDPGYSDFKLSALELPE